MEPPLFFIFVLLCVVDPIGSVRVGRVARPFHVGTAIRVRSRSMSIRLR